MIVAPTMDVVKRGILIGFGEKLASGLGRVLTKRKFNGSLALPITTTRVVGTLQIVFTNLIMIIHVNRATNGPSMSSIVDGGTKV
jgi:hypothetical protein